MSATHCFGSGPVPRTGHAVTLGYVLSHSCGGAKGGPGRQYWGAGQGAQTVPPSQAVESGFRALASVGAADSSTCLELSHGHYSGTKAGECWRCRCCVQLHVSLSLRAWQPCMKVSE